MNQETKKNLTDQEISASNPADLSPEDFERYYALKEIEWAEIRKVPHKVIDGVPVEMTEIEIEEFNAVPEDHNEVVLKNTKMTLVLSRTKYLDKTDAKMLKALDQNIDYYPEKDSRVKAREEIISIKSCKTLQELERFSVEFLEVDKNLKETLIASIKQSAKKRIDDTYPEWQQRNYMASVCEIQNKEIVAMKTIPFIAQYQLTPEELQTLKDAHTCKKFITNIRVKSNELETSLDLMTDQELNDFDPSEDSNWE